MQKLMTELSEKGALNGYWLIEDEGIASKRAMLDAQIEVKILWIIITELRGYFNSPQLVIFIFDH